MKTVFRLLANIVTWMAIGAVFAFVAGFLIACFVPPAPMPGGGTSPDGPLMLGLKAAVTGACIGFFIGLFGPRIYDGEL
jgi:hypothetical protein